jgi:hypothetical protein
VHKIVGQKGTGLEVFTDVAGKLILVGILEWIF